MPDSAKFGDIGVDTFGHILEKMGSLEIPNLRKLGMLNLHPAGKWRALRIPRGDIRIWVKLAMERYHDRTLGDDGNQNRKPFKTFTETGFPPELIAELEKRCGKE